jgi:protein-disulfide isomerase
MEAPSQEVHPMKYSSKLFFLTLTAVLSLVPLTSAKAAHLLRGSESARVQVVVYGDLQCPYSSRFVGYADRFEADFGDKIGLSFAHFPLSFHPEAMPASIAAYCAGVQGKAAPFIIEASKNFSKLNAEFYIETAQQAGVADLTAFANCQASAEAKSAVETERDRGVALGVTGTPNVFINGEPMKGAYPYEDFKAAVEKALK